MLTQMNPMNLNSGTCPSCRGRGLKVISSQRNTMSNSTCRRYECSKCSHRFTRYEVSEAFFRQAVENERILNKLKDYMDKLSGTPVKSSRNCHNCEYNVNENCSFELPEFGTEDADGCSYFRLKCQISHSESLAA